MKSKQSWIVEHPHIVIGFVLIICLSPFLNQAIQTDDTLFVWAGQWIQKHPADFFGSKVNWWFSTIPMWVANWNPPLMSYFLAGVASLFGWHEITLHLACIVVAFVACSGIYSLACAWCERPLLATIIAMFMPAFLVSSTTLMCDVLMLAFWVWALVFWERALGNQQSLWLFVGAGTLAGLAVLTKFSVVTLLPLLPILSLLRTGKTGWWLLGLAVPLIMLAGYEWLTASMYGKGLFSAASYHAQTFRTSYTGGGWKVSVITGLAFAGGCLLPLLFFSPLLWQRRVFFAGSVVIFGALLATFLLSDNLGLTISDSGSMKQWSYLTQVLLLTAGGLYLLMLIATEARRWRDVISTLLVIWIASGLLFATVLNWTVNARSFLPIVPAVAILLVRRLSAMHRGSVSFWLVLLPLMPTAAITMGVVLANYQLANTGKIAADQITASYKSVGQQFWFEGHGGFQYYMEQLAGRPIDVEGSLLRPGDIVVVPELGIRVPLPQFSVGWVQQIQYKPSSWFNLMGSTKMGSAGFYSANMGPCPFYIGNLPEQNYFVVKVFSRVQFKSRPSNQHAVQAGDIPDFQDISNCVDDQTFFPVNPETIKQASSIQQLEHDGKTEEAIQHYRKALSLNPNNPILLNGLAWMLAANSRSELRNGQEAVQLATKAVELTNYRVPVFIGTLAAADAEAGQFAQAIKMAQIARSLASVNGQQDVVRTNEKLLGLYISGKTAAMTDAP